MGTFSYVVIDRSVELENGLDLPIITQNTNKVETEGTSSSILCFLDSFVRFSLPLIPQEMAVWDIKALNRNAGNRFISTVGKAHDAKKKRGRWRFMSATTNWPFFRVKLSCADISGPRSGPDVIASRRRR